MELRVLGFGFRASCVAWDGQAQNFGEYGAGTRVAGFPSVFI